MMIILAFIAGCSHKSPKNVSKTVDQLIAEDHYQKALNVINNADSTKATANLDSLRKKVHLTYGVFLEYHGKPGVQMHKRMTGALRQYIEVLKIDPNNQKATNEIKQIMGIYQSMPNKSPGKDIVSDLRKLGFNY